jgi:hypothetical protein
MRRRYIPPYTRYKSSYAQEALSAPPAGPAWTSGLTGGAAPWTPSATLATRPWLADRSRARAQARTCLLSEGEHVLRYMECEVRLLPVTVRARRASRCRYKPDLAQSWPGDSACEIWSFCLFLYCCMRNGPVGQQVSRAFNCLSQLAFCGHASPCPALHQTTSPSLTVFIGIVPYPVHPCVHAG